MFWYVGEKPTSGGDVISALYAWLALFGPMRVFFTDAGGEYSGKALDEFRTQFNIKHLYSPPQSPFTNGICERHNSIAKLWISKLAAQCPNHTMKDIAAEAQIVKNITTRRHNFTSQFQLTISSRNFI